MNKRIDASEYGKRFQFERYFSDEPVRLDKLELVQIGELFMEAGFAVPEHAQFCHEISYIVSGRGTFCLDGKNMEVEAGDVIIDPEHGVHSIVADSGQPLFFAYAGFRFVEGAALPAALCESYQISRQRKTQSRCGVYEYFSKCMDEFYTRRQPELLLIESCLIQLVVWSSREFENPSNKSRGPVQCMNAGDLVYRILREVDSRLEEPLTVSGLAKILGYSPCYLSHVFREKMGQTLQEHITESKAEKACELLSLKRYSISEVAEQLGYESVQAFSRSFKRARGQNPTDYVRAL